jgi:hypothetical protein
MLDSCSVAEQPSRANDFYCCQGKDSFSNLFSAWREEGRSEMARVDVNLAGRRTCNQETDEPPNRINERAGRERCKTMSDTELS